MSGLDLVSFHRKLLKSPERMQFYRKAILDVVNKGDVVLDLGCGSGILGLFACQAGAGKVYSVEKSDAIKFARELGRANGYEDRIVYLHGDIREVIITDKIDVIVSELISKAVLGQKMAETINWCRDHLLDQEHGRIVPESVTLFVAPITHDELFAKTLLPNTNEYNLDFGILQKRSSNTPLSFKLPSESLLTSGKQAYHYDAYKSGSCDYFTTRLEYTIGNATAIHGYALWFESNLSPGSILSNRPPGIPAWDNLILPLYEPLQSQEGDLLTLDLSARDDSNMPQMWTWNTTLSRNGAIISQMKQSNFFAST